MPKHLKPNHSLAKRTLFLLFVFSLLNGAGNARNVSEQTTSSTKVNQSSQSTAATEVLKTSFGAAVEAVSGFKPFYLTGDFNGDGAQDIAIVVRIKGRRSELPPDVRLLNPFDSGARANFPAEPAAKPTLAFAIIHGTNNAGWKTSQPAGKFLLLGESPILILEYDRSAGSAADAKNLMEILSKRGKRRRGTNWPPTAAKGDSILLETEATESILYWNGKTYRWEESGDAA